ncbi:enoyl-CoA hydratase-related protein [Alphaproteobacteria bacterium]|nr:enoyl-CoA hydratase-related protein [Alphaproteobacteria bacterium]MDC6452165.1 enoyl-CoA hydratase-related protein [Alphaproteobacteria bacterium]
MKKETIIVKQEQNGICEIVLNEPDKHNSLSPKMIEELGDAFDLFKEDTKVKVLIISSTGKSFCAGGDLDWMKKQIFSNRATRIKEANKLAHLLYKMYQFPKPLVAKVEGNAFGGGIGIISVCDIAICTENIKLALTEVKLGLIPATISPYVILKIGSNNALDLFTSGRNFNAQDAKEMGLVKSFCKNENIENIISSETEPFLLNAPSAMSASKMLVKSLSFKIDKETVKFTVEALADVWENPEAIEGINAFFEKRKPNWLMEN